MIKMMSPCRICRYYEENLVPYLSTERTVTTDQSTRHQLGLISLPCPYEENLGP